MDVGSGGGRRERWWTSGAVVDRQVGPGEPTCRSRAVGGRAPGAHEVHPGLRAADEVQFTAVVPLVRIARQTPAGEDARHFTARRSVRVGPEDSPSAGAAGA
ncbi:hypothetical protein AB0H42_05320 [Nocardia sp. NPDC050799]|uniref:hypothetical protein n=1 Tax=Nocardia sp. NPDC050799 TaxID=3154842 RepID=UPI0033C49A9A